MTLTATDKLAGSAQNLHFVQINGASGAPIAGGCTSTIASITFGPTLAEADTGARSSARRRTRA